MRAIDVVEAKFVRPVRMSANAKAEFSVVLIEAAEEDRIQDSQGELEQRPGDRERERQPKRQQQLAVLRLCES